MSEDRRQPALGRQQQQRAARAVGSLLGPQFLVMTELISLPAWDRTSLEIARVRRSRA